MTTPAAADPERVRPMVACPRCGMLTPWGGDNTYRPFCSERCKLIDFGHWASESYRVPDSGKREADDGREP
ncbi:MAG: DNA gyrase inhibitor YacG [Burkholderiales bacterium]